MRSVVTFFVLTYVASWTCFLVAPALPGDGASMLRLPILLLGTFAPSLVALALTAWNEGASGTERLMARVFRADVALRWYVFAIGYYAAIKLCVALAHRLIAGAWPRFGVEAWYVIPVAIVFSTPVQAGEEIGWRGYALPRLAKTFGLGGASIVLGLAWAVWHLPLFYVVGLDNYGQSFPLFTIGVVPLSVALAWLYGQTRGSLLLTMLMHSAVNQTVGIVPSATATPGNPLAFHPSLAAGLTMAFMWIAAVYFLARMPRLDAKS